jgi:hypothetical protein
MNIIGIGAAIIAVGVGIAWYRADPTSLGDGTQQPAKTEIAAPAVVRTPSLDHTKPWFIKAGYPVCLSEAGLDALISNSVDAQNHSLKEPKLTDCTTLPDDRPVVEVDHIGWLQPDYVVRMSKGLLVVVPAIALRN